MALTRIPVRSHAGKYSIVCGTGALKHAAKEIAGLGNFSSVHIITAPKVWRAVAKHVPGDLVAQKSAIHLMSDAETHKDMRNVETLCRSLVRGGADRKSLIVAIGGGVTGDVAGFAAASYLRGVALVHVPTTLVSQVDSSIGGKTGVNLPDGKNLVGAFFPPRLILTDPAVLRSLPDREFRGGLAEVIKHAIIADAKMYGYIERNMAKILKRDVAALEYLIPRNAAIKAYVVSKDEKESGLREILNFGHTFAHALESTTKYQRFQHGEAVAWGMMAAALLAHETKVCGAEYVSRIVSLVRQIGPFPAWPSVQPDKLIDAMRSDKKTHHGKLRFVLSPKLGKAGSYDGISLDAVRKVLRFAPQFVAKPELLAAGADA
jgi:3-dehydroquinate synthase